MLPLDELEKFEMLLSEWIADLPNKILTINAELLDKMNVFLDKFDFSLNIGQNLNVLLEIQTALPMMLQSVGYVALINELVKKIDDSLTKLEGYFTNIFDNYPEKGTAITSAYRVALEQVRRSLLGEGLQQSYVTDIVKTLQFHVYSKSQKSVFREALKKVLGENGQPLRYVTTYSSDALYQFSRAYTEEITKALDTKYYYYMGTKIKTTRSFCRDRVGKAYKKSEVQGWAKLDWGGKIAGTNGQNIVMYVGGYNCRHRLLPISKEMYEQMTGQ